MSRLPLLLLCACAGGELELAVDVISDLQPGVEVDRIALSLDGEQVFEDLPRDLEEGARAVDLSVAEGDHTLVGVAFFNGERVAERRIIVRVRENQGVTVPLTRNCRDVTCGGEQTCANAVCVEARCSPENPEACPAEGLCTTSPSCPSGSVCGAGTCRRGACLVVDDGRCASGLVCVADRCASPPSATIDAGFDGGTDAGFDGGTDAGFDGGTDAGFDGGTDASTRLCPEPWGDLPVEYAALVGEADEEQAHISVTPGNDLLGATMSMDLWLRFIGPLELTTLLSSRQGLTGGYAILFSGTDGDHASLQYTLNDSGTAFAVRDIADGCWHHIALVRNLPEGELIYYLDGVRRAEPSADVRTEPLAAGSEALSIGRDPFISTGSPMAIHHLRFWNTVLTDAQVAELLTNRASPDDETLIGEIPMQASRDEGGLQVIESVGGLTAFLGSSEAPVGASPARLLSLDELDTYVREL